jgi:import inner membrane translocase subunit TIM8
MGLFGGSNESNSGEYASKMRSSSSYSSGEFDTSPDTSSFNSSSIGDFGGTSSGAGNIQQAVALEQQKLQFMQQVHKLNDVCWDMCLGSPSSSLSGREETCLTNCVERFVDTSVLLVNRFSQLAQRMGGGR